MLYTKIVSKEDLKLNPHGIDLIEVGNTILIYVINHKTDLSEGTKLFFFLQKIIFPNLQTFVIFSYIFSFFPNPYKF